MIDATHLARIHAACFPPGQAWSQAEMNALLATPGCVAIQEVNGFALIRVAAEEAELLTIAVLPEARRFGVARGLLHGFDRQAKAMGATTAFLEVAADNEGAIALYTHTGWAESGRRPKYYARTDGPRADAILMRKTLT